MLSFDLRPSHRVGSSTGVNPFTGDPIVRPKFRMTDAEFARVQALWKSSASAFLGSIRPAGGNLRSEVPPAEIARALFKLCTSGNLVCGIQPPDLEYAVEVCTTATAFTASVGRIVETCAIREAFLLPQYVSPLAGERRTRGRPTMNAAQHARAKERMRGCRPFFERMRFSKFGVHLVLTSWTQESGRAVFELCTAGCLEFSTPIDFRTKVATSVLALRTIVANAARSIDF